MKMKLNPLDILFSEFIRKRAMSRIGGCERCLKHKVNYKHLQCSHFHGRSRKSVRWDEDNAAGLCPGCHIYFTSNPILHTEWFISYLGKQKFDMLYSRMRNMGKPDVELLSLYYKEKIKELEAGYANEQ